MSTVKFLLVILVAVFSINCGQIDAGDNDPGQPLYLTPLIQNDKLGDARKEARVIFKEFGNTESYSGFFTVDPNFDSHLFFWYFPAEQDFKNAPLLVWLQGGPGASSLFGLFVENGPFILSQNGSVSKRETTWTKHHSVIYIDNPVGTGFSNTHNGYAANETKVGADLYSALVQFLTVFPELQDKPFYITGESYAGKYVPALGHTIHVNNPQAKLKINLQGLVIGNGLTDPYHQIGRGLFLYEIGLVDANLRDKLYANDTKYQAYLREENYSKALDIWNWSLDNFVDAANFSSVYNFIYESDPIDEPSKIFGTFVQTAEVRKAIHVGNTPFYELNNPDVFKYLSNDFLQSVAPWLSELLSYHRVLIYTGQLDIIIAYPLTLNYLQNLNFTGANEYANSTRNVWHSNNKKVAGYWRAGGNLTELLVRNAGHYVPFFQPEWAEEMIYKYTRSIPFSNIH